MKPRFKREAGPATRPTLFITSLGGVKAVMTNPFAWVVDPCLGCFPWPHRSETQGTSPELEGGPPPSLWQAGGGPVSAEMARPADSQGVFAAPLGSTPAASTPTSSGPVSTQPISAPPAGSVQPDGCAPGWVMRFGRCVKQFGA